ncbi:DUF2963 domain-containing protein [Candidatus Phytoplasma australiense]|uniref:DUF2963 domain-containing protein n=1 Tax=Phytoplasma australiense TaxID=59748 RepID=UPI002A4E1ACD|nr:DUF2963 domain-containing protein [Candidatus Phytoplasma australiense]
MIKKTKWNEYYSDGETIYYITEYHPETEEVIKPTNYNSDCKLTTEIFYDGDGETIDYITEFKYHPKTNKYFN